MDPIQIPDGVYARVQEPHPGQHIQETIACTIRVARGRGDSVYLVFNGTSVEVKPDDSVGGVFERWNAHRAAYQEGV